MAGETYPASRYTDPMTDPTLYERLLGIEHVGDELVCPTWGTGCPGYDPRSRCWRHLDTMQYRTLVGAEVPRVRCAEHGIQQVSVPWAETGSRFTALFEAKVIDWLKAASFSAVAARLRLSWDGVTGIQQPAACVNLSHMAENSARLLFIEELGHLPYVAREV